jgi:hypothetical protein
MASSRANTDRYLWNAITLAVFAALCVLSFALIFFYGDTHVSPFGFFDLTVLGLGAFRLIHLITFDQILDFARAAVMDSAGKPLKSAERGWRRAVCELVQCIWCAGLWSALIIVTVYLLGGWGRMAVLVVAVAGLGSLLQVASKAVAGGRII